MAVTLLAAILVAVVPGCGRDRPGRSTAAPTTTPPAGLAGRIDASRSTADPTRTAPPTTRRRAPATTAAPRAAAAPAGPRLLFGIGPEANLARTTPLARQAPVRMLTSWYNGPGDLGWMAAWPASSPDRPVGPACT